MINVCFLCIFWNILRSLSMHVHAPMHMLKFYFPSNTVKMLFYHILAFTDTFTKSGICLSVICLQVLCVFSLVAFKIFILGLSQFLLIVSRLASFYWSSLRFLGLLELKNTRTFMSSGKFASISVPGLPLIHLLYPLLLVLA